MLRRFRALDVSPQLPLYPTAVAVLIGDVIGLFLLIVWGLYAHNTPAWEFPAHTLETLTPFLVAWLVLAPLVGLYHRRTLRSYRGTLGVLVGGWVLVSLTGSLVRATPLFDGGTSPIFVLVNVAFGLVILLPWRFAVVTVLERAFPEAS